MPYGNHIAYTSKAVKVSLFDLSQQLLPTVTFSCGRGEGGGQRAEQNLAWVSSGRRSLYPFLPLYA